jgi:hypothetical protein
MSPGTPSDEARFVRPTAATRSWLTCDWTSVDELPPEVSASKNALQLALASWTMLATSRL